MKNDKKSLIICIVAFAAFLLLVALLKTVDVAAIGPEGSSVGLASLNGAWRDFVGSSEIFYKVTDCVEIPALLIMVLFAVAGFCQLVKRKKFFAVDENILALGCSYLVAVVVFVLFEVVKINFRPVLIDGVLETSFPSSTTILANVALLTAIPQIKKYISDGKWQKILSVACVVLCAFLVVGRIISGVHWLTDILGAIIISTGAVALYPVALGLVGKIKKAE